jgi:hypothetical protein
MITQLLTCPHCGTGFSTHGQVHTHGRDEHRDTTPKDPDLFYCVGCKEDIEARVLREGHEAENLDRAVKRI